jgi:uncharacterized protein YraI
MSTKTKNRIPLKLLSIFLLAVMVLTACASPTPAPTQDPGPIQTQAALDTINALTASAPTPGPTQVPAPGPTASIPVVNVGLLTPAAGQPAAIANYNTYVFGGPGENYVVYTAFLGGQQAVVVGKNADASWWALSMPNTPTGSGWVSAGWVTAVGAENVPVLPTPPVPPTTELVPPGPEDPVAVVLYNSYIRTGPGENYPAYGIAQPEATGRVIGKSMDGQWWAIRLDPTIVGNGMGWAAAWTVEVTKAANVPSIETPPASDVAPLPPPASGAPQATSVDYVNVRSGPGEQYPILAVAGPGATGEVSGVSSDQQWWQVKIPTQYSADGFGWVSASYVTTANTSGVPVVAAPPAPVVPATTPVPSSSCALLSQSPADYTVMAPDASFTTNWTVKNTGTETWSTDSYDVKYLGASSIPFHQGSDGYDMPTNVEPGWTYSVAVPMIAPANKGTFGEAWGIVQGSNTVCTFWVWITVE